MDRLEAMTVLLAVVEAGSLSAAGRRLRMPLPTVSRKVSDLEAHLKARLLTRSTRRLTLTDAGQTYVQACRRILEDVQQAERTAAGEFAAPRGELTLAAPIVFGRLHVLPVVTAFLEAYAEVDVHLALADRVAHLQDEHIDAAVRIGELADSRLGATRVGSVRRVVCASPAYLARHGEPRHPRELASHRGVSFSGLTAGDAWSFEVDGKHEQAPIRSRLVVNTAEAAVDAAIAGVGLTRVLSYQVDAALRDRALARVLRHCEPAPIPVHLVFGGLQRVPQKLRAFIDFAVPRLRERLAGADPDRLG